MCSIYLNEVNRISKTYGAELGFSNGDTEKYPEVLVLARLPSTHAGRSITPYQEIFDTSNITIGEKVIFHFETPLKILNFVMD
jgi:hypothetical protein